MVQKILFITLSSLLGLVFIYSAYAKLFPVIETFEFTFIDIGIADWYTAPFIARLLIGFEFFVGILLLSNFTLLKFTIPLTICVLSLFVIYLVFQILLNGNSGNCGCFGEQISMTPMMALIKNGVMIGISLVLYRYWPGWQMQYHRLLLSIVGATTVMLPFLLNPVDLAYSSNNLDEKVNYVLDLDLLYHPDDTSKVQVPEMNLKEGKNIVAFLSLTCHHCRIAAKKFRLIKKKNPDIPIYFLLNGEHNRYREFIEDTRANNIPYSFCNGKAFVKLAGTQLPRIYYLENAVVVKKVDYFELNQYSIEHWLTTGFPN